jgi:penicillin-binding protein 2
MATSDVNLADRSGSLVESHKGYDPRIIFFYFLMAALLLTLAGGLAYEQLIKTGVHSEAERQQNMRRVIVPGPRGNIYDREGRVLVGNRPVFSVVLYVDELRAELRWEQIRIRNNYRKIDDKNVPSRSEIEQIARVSVTQSYLDKVVAILHRDPASAEARVDPARVKRHFRSALLLPYTLLNDLTPADYARLIEELPVKSPLQVYASSTRYYPYGSAAAHTLGAVRLNDEQDAEDFPGDDLHTLTMKGAVGRSGLEKQFDDVLQGTPGGSIFRVDPSGFRINPPLEQRTPRQGKSISTSIDIDLQEVAEQQIGDQTGAAVALDVATGEVLVIASKPDYDLNQFSPHTTQAVVDRLNATGGWNNLALDGLYPPGSTFKPVVSIAGLLGGRLNPADTSVDCEGITYIGRQRKTCENGDVRHGHLDLSEAIALSCDIYFYWHGIRDIGPSTIAAEARRFHLDQPTGIELPGETRGMIIPDAKWLRKTRDEAWTDGHTANMAIGQGDVLVTPLEMACLAASIARGETVTKPTLLHDAGRPPQHSEPIGLTPSQRAALVAGMVGCVTHGTAKLLNTIPSLEIPGIQIAGKTGTAQKRVVKDGKVGNINFAWFICFAPAENPRIAMAVMIEGDTIGENFGGGMHAAPVAAAVIKKYFEKQARATNSSLTGLGKLGVAAAP